MNAMDKIIKGSLLDKAVNITKAHARSGASGRRADIMLKEVYNTLKELQADVEAGEED